MRNHFVMFLIIILTACSSPPNPDILIEQSVVSTLAALPTSTPYPIPSPYPSPTPLDLRGIFCEYQFCVGHPAEIAFFDVSAQNNPGAPSTYSQGLIAAFNGKLFIQMIWQLSPGTSDPQFMFELVIDPETDVRNGNMDVKLIRDMNVIFIPITSTATPVLPYGAAAAWICGDRAFAWKTYSPHDNNSQVLFETSFNRFECTR